MRVSLRSIYWQTAAIVIALSFGVSAYAESAREGLSHAYVLLRAANGDYGGHRANALKEIKAAGKALGVDLEGGGSGHERQLKSDEQVAEARRLLREVRDKFDEHDRDRVTVNVDKAIKELDAALRTK